MNGWDRYSARMTRISMSVRQWLAALLLPGLVILNRFMLSVPDVPSQKVFWIELVLIGISVSLAWHAFTDHRVIGVSISVASIVTILITTDWFYGRIPLNGW